MYRHILVAVDLSELAYSVVEQAIALAQGTGATLTFLHVLCNEEITSPAMPLIPVPEYYPSLSTTTLELYQEEWNAFEARGLAVLETYRTQAKAAGLQADFLQRSGHPGSVICAAAADLQVDLIAIGRRGHSGLSEWLLGSVSNYVVHHATSAVLVCHVSKTVTGEGRSSQDALPELI